MRHSNHNRDWQAAEHDALDTELTAALARFAALEPRAGIEQRILANLRVARQRSADRSWWWGAVMVVSTAVVIVAVALTWRSGKPFHPPVTSSSSPAQSPQRDVARDGGEIEALGSGPRSSEARPHNVEVPPTKAAHRSQRPIVAAEPRLDQFPSPQPLSEQEKILESYVAQYPERAVLVARAQAEALRQDREEEMRGSSPANDKDSQQRSNQ